MLTLFVSKAVSKAVWQGSGSSVEQIPVPSFMPSCVRLAFQGLGPCLVRPPFRQQQQPPAARDARPRPGSFDGSFDGSFIAVQSDGHAARPARSASAPQQKLQTTFPWHS